MSETIEQLGEEELLKRLANFAPPGQFTDDTAQFNPEGKEILINTDLLVDGIHFTELTTSPQDIGWRATAANISDLVASGVHEIIGITVGLVVPPTTTWSWIEGVYEGISLALNKFGGKLLGGDCSCGKEKVIAITAVGTLGPLRLLRNKALPGDYLVVSGPHGLSRLGLALLRSEEIPKKILLKEDLKNKAIIAHQRPEPNLIALDTLKKCKPKNLPWRAGGTDSSDGLLEAVKNLCKGSKCLAELDYEKLPTSPDWPTGKEWQDWCLSGGEDFEIVVSLPPQWAKAWIKTCASSQIIGCIKPGPSIVTWSNGKEIVPSTNNFKHF